MSAVAALRLPLEVDLGAFIALLRRLRVPYRVSEESGEQVLWVPDEPLAEQVRQLYARYPEGDPQAALVVDEPADEGWLQRLRGKPVTVAVLGLTLIVAALTFVGDNAAAIRWFTFQDFRIDGGYLYFSTLGDSLAAGQWWRLLTPMLLHFGFLHLAMNSMWYWELGRRIEAHQGSLALLGLTLVFGLVSNFAQYLHAGPSLFGGLSGVLYGLLGHCWLYQKLAPNPAYRLPPGVVVLMLVWLVVCMTGVFEWLGIAAIANAAHVGGLVVGCLTGVAGGALARLRHRQ
ncbi:rhomboid family intramembrane serine protease [Pseudomonas indica]|uniref:GlpG protein n=1 Tax=Pseudomonas indica TaxID=137658 RepID=A0A1G9C3K1_9PSED|nr:rhomboid family intramembrane serine protease [Pseudomonas indica]PAU55960.1 rhomboid family intramembrane serine protease [Pseudomonas indica]SDK46270.1 GlpG protein [Pseudomonas indica]